MKRIFWGMALLLCGTLPLTAQNKETKESKEEKAKLEAQRKAVLEARTKLWKEINKQIWEQFSQAYANDKPEKYIALHSNDLIRAQSESKIVVGLSEYADGVLGSFGRWRAVKAKIAINFRFLERIVNTTVASEIGIFELSFTTKEGKVEKFYGKFHVFLKKEGNNWKIVMDYDSNEKNAVNEAAYKAALPMDAFDKF